MAGNISFEPKIELAAGVRPWNLAVGDLDGDGKPDIAAANNGGGTITVYRNTSIIGSITFDTAQTYVVGTFPQKISIADLNGDGKPEIVVTNSAFGISVFKNESIPGTIIMSGKVNYSAGPGTGPASISISDIDSDGRPDIIVACINSTATVLRNKIGETTKFCMDKPATLTSNIIGTKYQWQLNTGSGFADIIDNSDYSGVETNTLQFSNVPSSWQDHQYRCIVDGNGGIVFKIRFASFWTGAISNEWEEPQNWSCGSLPGPQTDVIINAGGVVNLNSSQTIRSLRCDKSATVEVKEGYTLTIAP